jgi:hypothetical protein
MNIDTALWNEAEELILPCAEDIVSIMIRNDYILKAQPLSLSDDNN